MDAVDPAIIRSLKKSRIRKEIIFVIPIVIRD